MSTEQTTATTDTTQADEAAFRAAFERQQSGQTQPETPAAPATPAQETKPAAAEALAQAEPEDEYAGLSPKVREQLAQLDELKRATALIPTLEQRVRKAEGRLGDLNGRIPPPTPPAPPKLEKVEKLKEDWPDVVDAMEELLQNRHGKPTATADEGSAQAAGDDLPTPTLDEEMPGWDEKLVSPQFQTWLAAQSADYRTKVTSTKSEGVVLAALTKFDAHTELQRTRQAAAQQAAVTRQTRAAAAAVPQTAGARAPTQLTDEDVFRQAFKNARGAS